MGEGTGTRYLGDRWTKTDDVGLCFSDTWQESDLKADDVSIEGVQQSLEALVLQDSSSKAVHIIAHNAHPRIGIRPKATVVQDPVDR